MALSVQTNVSAMLALQNLNKTNMGPRKEDIESQLDVNLRPSAVNTPLALIYAILDADAAG